MLPQSDKQKLLNEIVSFKFKEKNNVTNSKKETNENTTIENKNQEKSDYYNELKNKFADYDYNFSDDDFGSFYPDDYGDIDESFRDCSGTYFDDPNDAFAYGDIDWGSN